MDRVLKGTPATISVTYYVGETPTDPSPDSATVRLVREDGTELQATTPAVNAGTGQFTYNLTPTHTANLDILTAQWVLTVGGNPITLTTTVEVVGGFLFNLADARNVKPLDDTVTYTVAKIAAARTLAETALEEACGVAFVPRYRRDIVDAPLHYGQLLTLEKPRVTAVRSIKLNGTAFTSGQLAQVIPRKSGLLYNVTGWSGVSAGLSNYEVEYEHGYAFPPPRVGRAALLLARRWLVDSPIDDRATSLSTEDGTFALVTAGTRGNTFDVPEANAVVEEYGQWVRVA